MCIESVSSLESKASPNGSRSELWELWKEFENRLRRKQKKVSTKPTGVPNVLRLMMANLNAAVNKLSHNVLELNRASVREYKIPREFRMQLRASWLWPKLLVFAFGLIPCVPTGDFLARKKLGISVMIITNEWLQPKFTHRFLKNERRYNMLCSYSVRCKWVQNNLS